MNLLLDTHTFIWWDDDIQQLSTSAREALFDKSNILILGAASVWEMQIKIQTGKLKFSIPLDQRLDRHRTINQLQILSITSDHALKLEQLPNLHRDPFDRMLAAQCIAEGLTLVTSDPILHQYPVPILW